MLLNVGNCMIDTIDRMDALARHRWSSHPLYGLGGVTEEKRRQRSRVERRAACMTEGTFEQLVEAIEWDVGLFNRLAAEKRGSREFKYTRYDLASMYVAAVGDSGD